MRHRRSGEHGEEKQNGGRDKPETCAVSGMASRSVALFGLGDHENYPDSFVDAMGTLYDEVVMSGAEVVGSMDASEFTFTNSRAQRNGELVGLVLDEDNEPDKTVARIAAWVGRLAWNSRRERARPPEDARVRSRGEGDEAGRRKTALRDAKRRPPLTRP